MEGARQDVTRQAIVNLTEDAMWNLLSACSNTGKSPGTLKILVVTTLCFLFCASYVAAHHGCCCRCYCVAQCFAAGDGHGVK